MESFPKKRKLKKLSCKWKSYEVWKLITNLRSYPELWDETCSDYRDQGKRYKSLITISKILNKDEEDVSAKWQKLRSQYIEELRKIRDKKVGSSWQYFNALKFLGQSIKNEPFLHQNTNDSMNNGDYENLKESEQKSYENLRREIILNSAINLLENQADDIKLFIDYVASELRKMKPEIQEKIKSNILKDILASKTEAKTVNSMRIIK